MSDDREPTIEEIVSSLERRVGVTKRCAASNCSAPVAGRRRRFCSVACADRERKRRQRRANAVMPIAEHSVSSYLLSIALEYASPDVAELFILDAVRFANLRP